MEVNKVEASRMTALTDEDIDLLNRTAEVREESPKEAAQRIFEAYLIPAVQSMCNMAIHSESERIRIQAAQYVIERNIGRVQDNPPEPPRDPFKDLLAECSVAITNDEMDALRAMVAKGEDQDVESDVETGSTGSGE